MKLLWMKAAYGFTQRIEYELAVFYFVGLCSAPVQQQYLSSFSVRNIPMCAISKYWYHTWYIHGSVLFGLVRSVLVRHLFFCYCFNKKSSVHVSAVQVEYVSRDIDEIRRVLALPEEEFVRRQARLCSIIDSIKRRVSIFWYGITWGVYSLYCIPYSNDHWPRIPIRGSPGQAAWGSEVNGHLTFPTRVLIFPANVLIMK